MTAMEDLLALLNKIRSTPQALMWRFAPLSLTVFIYTTYRAFHLDGLVPTEWHNAINLGALTLVSFSAVSALVLFPNERHWIQRIQSAIDSMCWLYAEYELEHPPALLTYSAQFLARVMQARLLIARGKTEAALQELMQLTYTALTSEENFKLRLQFASLFFQAGNIRAFKAEYSRLIELSIPKHKDAHLNLSLLKAQLLETDAAFEDAKATLEDAFEYCTASQAKAVCYVNLGRLEDLRHNQQMALTCYERAWIELKQEPIPRHFQIIAHNLLIKYAQVGAINQAKALLAEYRQLVAGQAADQLLGFYNDQTDFARQVGDRSLLTQSYEDVANISGFDDKARYCIAAHELRMRLADGLSFIPTFEFVFNQFPLIELTDDERFRVLEQLREAWHLGQSLFVPQAWHAYGREIHLHYVANEHIVDDRLRMAPPTLPAIRDVWLKRKLEILRIKTGMSTSTLTAESFETIFSLAAERCRLWSDCDNIRQAVETRLVYVDDFMAYERQAGSLALNKFRDGAFSTLAEAEQLLDEHWPTPAVEQAIGIAYLSWKFTRDIAKRDGWLARFESRGLSLEHYQPWLREQYREMKGDQR